MTQVENVKQNEKIKQTLGDIEQFCTFRIAGRLFGLSLLDVREVNSELSFTKIFHADQSVRGYMNIRGQIHLVIDLRILLGFEPMQDFDEHRVVIFKPSVADASGVLVDSIADVVEVSSDLMEERRKDDQTGFVPDKREINAELIKGVCRLKDELLVVLDSKKIVDSVRDANRVV